MDIVSDCSVTVNIHYISKKLICFCINICINKWSQLFQVSGVIDMAGKMMGIRAIKSAYIYSFKTKLATWSLFFFLWICQCLGRGPLSCICARFWGFASRSCFNSDCVFTETRPSASHRRPPPQSLGSWQPYLSLSVSLVPWMFVYSIQIEHDNSRPLYILGGPRRSILLH